LRAFVALWRYLADFGVFLLPTWTSAAC